MEQLERPSNALEVEEAENSMSEVGQDLEENDFEEDEEEIGEDEEADESIPDLQHNVGEKLLKQFSKNQDQSSYLSSQ